MPENPTNITVAGDWSKPATTLIEKIADAVGGIARPHQIVRVAKAEAKASHIRAKAEIEVKSLERRATRRFIAEEAKKQANMEQIIRDALPLLEEKAKPETVDDDWITNFFEKARITSDEEMQRLWSKILAGEANSPGVFSRKTVNLVSDLGKPDAEIFTQLCGFAWSLPELVVFIFDVKDEIYNGRGIYFESLAHLESLGLVRFDAVASFVRQTLAKNVEVSYFGRTLELTLPEPSDNSLAVGNTLLTRAGTELALVCGASPVEGFFEFIQRRWQQAGYLPKDMPAAPAQPNAAHE
jgi:hypothetical protein